MLGAALAAGLVLAAARWAPERLESALHWTLGTVHPETAPLPAKPPAERPGKGRKPKAPPEPPAVTAAADDPRTRAVRRRVRERVNRIVEDSRRGVLPRGPIEFTQEEVQAALTDPRGPLEGKPPGLQADLLEGKVRLSWNARLFGEETDPAWLARLPGVKASFVVAPRVENGRLLCPLVSARVGPLPIPGPALRAVAPLLPSAPKLPPRAGVLLPAGIGWVEVKDDRVRLAPDPPWMAEN